MTCTFLVSDLYLCLLFLVSDLYLCLVFLVSDLYLYLLFLVSDLNLCLLFLVSDLYLYLVFLVSDLYLYRLFLVSDVFVCLLFLISDVFVCLLFLVSDVYLCLLFLVSDLYICLLFLGSYLYLCLLFLVSDVYICLLFLVSDLYICLLFLVRDLYLCLLFLVSDLFLFNKFRAKSWCSNLSLWQRKADIFFFVVLLFVSQLELEVSVLVRFFCKRWIGHGTGSRIPTSDKMHAHWVCFCSWHSVIWDSEHQDLCGLCDRVQGTQTGFQFKSLPKELSVAAPGAMQGSSYWLSAWVGHPSHWLFIQSGKIRFSAV